MEERLAMTGIGATFVGNYVYGQSYRAGTQQVVFFAEQVKADFTAGNAKAAWLQVTGIELHGPLTLSNTAGVHVATSGLNTANAFLLLGWENLNTHQGGWLAARFNHAWTDDVQSGPWWWPTHTLVNHSSMDWISNSSTGQTNIEGPLTLNYNTNGYNVGLYAAPEPGSGTYEVVNGMYGTFRPPH
jgi:hypothetical protein